MVVRGGTEEVWVVVDWVEVVVVVLLLLGFTVLLVVVVLLVAV